MRSRVKSLKILKTHQAYSTIRVGSTIYMFHENPFNQKKEFMMKIILADEENFRVDFIAFTLPGTLCLPFFVFQAVDNYCVF